MDSAKHMVSLIGPKLLPFLKTVALYFLVFPSSEIPSIIGAFLKCLPIVCLMLFVILYRLSSEQKCGYTTRILVGLFFCCLGDAFLVWPNYFIPGMLAFAVGHIYYILAFGFKPLNPAVGVAVLASISAGILYLLPDIEGIILTLGVPVYIILLGVMMWRAVGQLNSFKDLRKFNKVIASLGGILFVLSDLTLGINMFKFRIKHSQTLIMSSYYAAQLCISLSVVDSSHYPKKI